MSKRGKNTDFASRLLEWFDRHGRHDLPWQHPREPYRVWLAEIMLQQTQVATVIPYFKRFLERCPDLRSLAAAPIDDVLALWAGLGYYSRARNLHACARLIVERHGGEFPRELDALVALPGIGRSTAGAILAQAFGQRQAILDGNVRRVLARHAGIAGWTGEPAVQKKLWALAESLLPQKRLVDYTQAMMDLGATVCSARKPACAICPVNQDCRARIENRTQELPGAKPKRVRPRRRSRMLVIANARGEILLERRPPTGIWGGLWCLPMLDEGEDWRAAARSRYSLRLSAPEELEPLHHAFTHFDLEILPLRLRAAQAPAIAEDAGVAWIKMGDLSRGLPAPVRKLLRSLPENSQCPEPSTA